MIDFDSPALRHLAAQLATQTSERLPAHQRAGAHALLERARESGLPRYAIPLQDRATTAPPALVLAGGSESDHGNAGPHWAASGRKLVWVASLLPDGLQDMIGCDLEHPLAIYYDWHRDRNRRTLDRLLLTPALDPNRQPRRLARAPAVALYAGRARFAFPRRFVSSVVAELASEADPESLIAGALALARRGLASEERRPWQTPCYLGGASFYSDEQDQPFEGGVLWPDDAPRPLLHLSFCGPDLVDRSLAATERLGLDHLDIVMPPGGSFDTAYVRWPDATPNASVFDDDTPF